METRLAGQKLAGMPPFRSVGHPSMPGTFLRAFDHSLVIKAPAILPIENIQMALKILNRNGTRLLF
jgi:hypothetical protein